MTNSLPEGSPSWLAVIELMLYGEEAIINCDNLLPCYIQREERDDRLKGKKTKSSEFIMKSSVKVCVHRKSSEWKDSSESWKSSIVF